MKTRSKSMPKLFCVGMYFFPPSKITDLHEKISNRVYGEKYTRANSKIKFVYSLDSQQEKPHISHERIQKSFDKYSQSSPNSRIKKIQEARAHQSKSLLRHCNSRHSVASSKEISLARQEVSHELLEKASLLLKKEKENTNNIARRSRDITGEIQIKINSAIKRCDRSQYRRSCIFK